MSKCTSANEANTKLRNPSDFDASAKVELKFKNDIITQSKEHTDIHFKYKKSKWILFVGEMVFYLDVFNNIARSEEHEGNKLYFTSLPGELHMILTFAHK